MKPLLTSPIWLVGRYGMMLGGCGFLFLFARPIAAQDKVLKPETSRLEEHLLRWPCFERPFDQLIERWHDASGWKHLDGHFERKQGGEPRYRVLRGMLAERLGDFAAASAHYAAVPPDDEWAVYHRARMLAFTGEIDSAKRELDALARRTGDSYLFKLAATGIAEVIMLQEDFAAAERFYTSLWDARTELRMRLALLEPLLSVKNELGTGDEWLETLKPNVPDGEKALSVTEVDKALLWMNGDTLGRFSASSFQSNFIPGNAASPPFPSSYLRLGSPLVTNLHYPGWFDTFFARSEPSRWFAEVDEEFHYLSPLSPDAVIKTIANQGDVGDGVFWRFYSDAVRSCSIKSERVGKDEAQTEFRQRVRLIRGRLRERPWIAASTFQLIGDAEMAKEIHDFFDREIFDGLDHPVWRFHSLLLRIQAGETPETLRQDALTLWRETKPEEVYNLFRERPNGTTSRNRMTARDPGPYYGTSARHDVDAGVTAPTTGIVWNLRGTGFVEAMRVRFPHGLQIEMFDGGSDDWMGVYVRPKSITAAPEQQSAVYQIARAGDGATLLRCLWRLRDQLGLKEADFEGGGGDMVTRAVDVLVRSDSARVRAFALAEPDLATLPGFWMRGLRKAVRLAPDGVKDYEADDKLAAEAGNRIDGIIANRHPDWFLSRFIAPVPAPVEESPAPDPTQVRQWLADFGKIKNVIELATTESIDEDKAFDLRWKDSWGRLVPGIELGSFNSLPIVEARRALAKESKPHPLWGMEWIPSVTRESRILSAAYDLKPSAPAFLTNRLPDLVRNPAASVGGTLSSDPDHVLFRATVKMVTAFGDEVLQPPSERETELQPYAAKYSFVADLLSLRSSLSKLSPSMRNADSGFTAAQLDEALRVLESSRTTRSKMVLASLHHHYGDKTKSHALAETLAKADGPAGAYLGFLNARSAVMPPVVSNTTPAPKAPQRTRETLVKRVKSILNDPNDNRPSKELFMSIAANEEERRWLYDWLKAEVKDDPVFAKQAGVMAELARDLGLTVAEITAAEELDRRLNQNGADYWMRRREDLGKQEIEAIIEAVKRSSFAPKEGRSAEWDLLPSLQRVVEAKRAGDLAAAFGTAMRQSPEGSGDHLAAAYFKQVLAGLIDSRRAENWEERIRELLGVVHERQRQLFLWNYDSLIELNEKFERDGDVGSSTTLARQLLRSAWTRGMIGGVDKALLPLTGQRHDLSAWSEGSRDEIEGKATILPLFDRALRGDGVKEFASAIMDDAAKKPQDEYLASCALMVHAKLGPLSAEALSILGKIEPQTAMRVAWRLCEFGPRENVRIADLVPALERGLVSIFEDEDRYLGSGSRHYLLAEKVCAWIERGGGGEAIRRLVPRFVEHADDINFPSTWEFAARIIATYGDAGAIAKLAERWKAHVDETVSKPFQTDWTVNSIAALTKSAHLAGEGGSPYAALAHDLWTRFDEVYGGSTDLPADSADRVGTSLLAMGDHDRLSALAASVELQVRFGGARGLPQVLRRLRHRLSLLAVESPALPAPEVWIDPPAEEGKGPILHWQLSQGRIDGEDAAKVVNRIAFEGASESRTVQVSQYSPPLRSLSKRYDLEVFAGETPTGLRPIAKVPLAEATGSRELTGLAPFGSVRGVLRIPQSEVTRFGDLSLFSIEKPIFDTFAPIAADAGGEFEGFGRKLGGPARVAAGTRLLIELAPSANTDASSESTPGLDSLFFIGLDDEKRTLFRANLSEIKMLSRDASFRSDGTHVLVWELSQLSGNRRFGVAEEVDAGDQRTLDRLHSLVLVGERGSESNLPLLRVRALPPDPVKDVSPSPLKELDHQVLSSIGFEYNSWHVSEKFPRAAFSGAGRMVVFDTSAIPWTRLFEVRDPLIKKDNRVYLLDEGGVCLSQWSADAEKGCAFYLIRWKGDTAESLDAFPKTEFPFDPKTGADGWKLDLISAESIPDDNGMLFMAGGYHGPLRVVCMDNTGKILSAQVERPYGESVGPRLAWWGKDSRFAVFEKGFLHHFEISDGALVAGAVEKGVLSPKEIPEGAVRGNGLFYPKWSLKRPDLLVRRDKETGAPQDGFRLKTPCSGRPIWLGGDSGKVFLQTAGFEMISVEPPSE